MTAGRTALVLANEADRDPGFVGDSLREQGYELEWALREEAGRWPDPRDFDLVLSLGSAWSAYWARVAEAVTRERDSLRLAIEAGVPALGICFGSQVLAAALGAVVVRAPSAEVGWLPVDTNDPPFIPAGPWFLLHGDSWTAPPGARILARTEVCPQAFAHGSVLGVQFHPEVTPRMVEGWVTRDPTTVLGAGLEPVDLIDQSRALAADARDRASKLVATFLDRTAGSASAGAA